MGCYRACFMPCEGTKIPFAADAIISNPAAVGSVHIAEALGIPLSMSCSESLGNTNTESQPCLGRQRPPFRIPCSACRVTRTNKPRTISPATSWPKHCAPRYREAYS